MNVDTATAIAILIAAVASAASSIIIAIRQPKIAAQVAAVHREVATSNGHTLGEIVEANDLTNVVDADPSPKLEP